MTKKRGAPALLRVEAVAEMLDVSTRTVWRLVSGGELPQPVAIGKCRRWRLADVEQFVSGLKS
jgi:excisionase family DNA binding protein